MPTVFRTHIKGDIADTEKVQRVTKLVTSFFFKLPYKEWLNMVLQNSVWASSFKYWSFLQTQSKSN